ncbi:MAG TPA: DnaB-like helicase N-terminal domain-containing protein, partial [Candidatus Omnitrophota bacterium]|nr:DnaB-like helicase N-terminal domain-containing protein [Candidatus Omnitrophota bacterium]
MIPPQNIEAERSVLGAMMIDDEAIGTALEILDVSWFYENSH